MEILINFPKTNKMQFNSIILFMLIFIFKFTHCAPTDTADSITDLEKFPQNVPGVHSVDSTANDRKKVDYYEWRHGVAEGVQRALDECREKFKWDRWNCPKRAFLDILDRSPLPSNKELGLTRALIASGIVLSLTRSCSYGTNNVCGCSNTNSMAARTPALTSPIEHFDNNMMAGANPEQMNKKLNHDHLAHHQAPASSDHNPLPVVADGAHTVDIPNKAAQYVWRGCDESVKFAFKVSKIYLESQDIQQDEASRKINAHNYEVGRLAVKKSMKRMCKCHGISGSCQVNTCWTSVPDMSKVGEYLKRQYRLAAKVGAMSAEETNIASLNKELSAINMDKLVFADASPDYCYENTKLGINGTLGRYCSRAKHRADGTEVSRSERDSCDRLCTKCGYKIKRERLNREKQCECRFVYCCSVECKRCPHEEDTYRCVRHS